VKAEEGAGHEPAPSAFPAGRNLFIDQVVADFAERAVTPTFDQLRLFRPPTIAVNAAVNACAIRSGLTSRAATRVEVRMELAASPRLHPRRFRNGRS
jgi:hypothetical protein